MTGHLSTEEIEAYLERRSARTELAAVNQHLFDCEACYQQFLSMFGARRAFPIEVDLDDLAGLKGWHLQGEELKAYVDGRMEEVDQEYASLHLKECAWCREAVDDYSEFGKNLWYYLSKRHAPLRQAASWTGYRAILAAISKSPPQLARAAALVLLLVCSAVVLWSVLRVNPAGQEDLLSKADKEESPLSTGTRLQDPALSSMPQTITPDADIKPSRLPDSGLKKAGTTSNKNKVADGEQESEADLIAKDLVMPSAIEVFDRSPVVLRGNGNQSETFNVISPYATLITDDRPIFRWTALSGATGYRVSIYDVNLNLVRISEPLTGTEWSTASRLRRGMTYTWIVTATKDGKEVLAPALPARAEFKVIEAPALAKFNRSIKRIHSRAACGVLYARFGLLDEAEQELRAHITSHPDDVRAKKLLQTIKSWRAPQAYMPPLPTTTKPPQ
jgi:hypothetical protein